MAEGSLGKIGSLLILMSFVATTLAITDPVGRLQKLYLVGRHIISNPKKLRDKLRASPSRIELKTLEEDREARKEEDREEYEKA